MFNKKNKLSRLLLVSVFLILGLVFLLNFGSTVLASDTFGTNVVANDIALGEKDPRSIATQVINIGMSVLGIIALAIVIYAGFLWMTAAGEEDKIEKAKKILKAGVIGLAIILASWGITVFVLSRLGNATGTTGNGTCTDGASRECGCGGVAICSDGEWGFCVGSSCCEGCHGSYCNGSLTPNVCSPDNTQCNSGLTCGNDCRCAWPGEGDPCGDSSSGTCSPNNDDCTNPNTICSASSCTCVSNNNDNGFAELGEACNSGSSCNATNDVCNPNHGLSCDTDSCTCIGDPVITAVSPVGGFCVNNINTFCEDDSQCPGSTCDKTTPNFAKGNFITIFGYNFDTYNPGNVNPSRVEIGTSSYFVNGQNPETINNSCVNTWTNNKIIVAIPTSSAFALGASGIEVKVITRKAKSDTTRNEVGPVLPYLVANSISRPGLCGMSETEAQANEDVYYYGVGLNNSQVYFGNGNIFTSVLAFIPNILNNDNSGVAKVPSITDGDTSTFVKRNNVDSNTLDFTKLADDPVGPFISSSTPDRGSAGQYVTITGGNFGEYKGSSSVSFRLNSSNTEASYDFPQVCLQSLWSNNQILIKVPAGLPNGSYNIVLKIGSWPEVVSNFNFVVDSNEQLKPSICKLSPKAGPKNTMVSFWGEYFGQNCKAIFTSNKSSIETNSQNDDGADKITVAVPAGTITGPVKISRNNKTGNSVNFSVGFCAKDDDCSISSPICCPLGSSQAGACVSNRDECFGATPPSSVFQWKFTTGLGNFDNQTDEDVDSCAGFNFCPDGYVCPNAPGVCSNYAGGNKLTSGKCRLDCTDYCETGECDYNSNLDRCVVKTGAITCSLNKTVSYKLSPTSATTTATAVCKKYNTPNEVQSYFKIDTNLSCPTGWITALPGECVDVATMGATSTCSLCGDGKTCYNQNNAGICVSERLCSSDYRCENYNGSDQCTKLDSSSCQCCCDKSDNVSENGPNPGCCAPLTCGYTCGASSNPNATATNFGLCSGCYISASSTTETRDSACNCVGTSGKYCDTDAKYPTGACLDCSALSETACKEHSATCCYDAKNNKCRGGASGSGVWGSNSSNIGMCPYYNCDTVNPTMCASSTPRTTGTYKDIISCDSDSGCKANCSAILNEDVCKDDPSCCWSANGTDSGNCIGGKKYSEDEDNSDYGLCTYFSCPTPGANACNKGTSTTSYTNEDACKNDCINNPSGFGKACFTDNGTNKFCTNAFCNRLSCLNSSGGQSGNNIPESCGTCCCDPNVADDDDVCGKINNKLSCLADKGACTGSSRGLCCGCSSDQDCSPETGRPTEDPEHPIEAEDTIRSLPTDVGCGIDSCCKARPTIKGTEFNKLDVKPEPFKNNVCRNGIIEINFNEKMDAMSLDGNILLLQEKPSGSQCSAGTSQIAGLTNIDNSNYKNRGVFAVLRNVFKKSVNSIAGLFGKTTIAAGGSVYCSVMGLIEINHASEDATSIYFKPSQLLDSNSTYYVVVKGDEELNSQTGVKGISGIGMNGKGYYNGDVNNPWKESDTASFNFSGVAYKNSYIWMFKTLNSSVAGEGVCTINYLNVSPSSYLFQDNQNDVNENDADALDKTFDSKNDRDKVYYVKALTSDGQLIGPTSGYSWSYNWSISNPNVLSFDDSVVRFTATSSNRLVRVKDGITYGESGVVATVNMSSGNLINDGNGTSASADAYILICENPWPAFRSDGTWVPWTDTSSYTNYNYKFYYCRDAGNKGFIDDLPAFMTDSAVIKGNSLTKVCSNNPSIACSSNSNCPGNALCVVNFLKETYLFRNARNRLISSFEVLNTADGGSIRLTWTAAADGVNSFAVRYALAGSSVDQLSTPVPTSACQLLSGNTQYSCTYILGGLSDNSSYNVRVVALSSNASELGSSFYTSVTPTFVPFVTNFSAEDTTVGRELKLSWRSKVDGVTAYKVEYTKVGTPQVNTTTVALSNCQNISGTNYCEYYLRELSNNSDYSLKILAINSSSAVMGRSNVLTAKPTYVPPPFFTNVSFTDTKVGGQVRASWKSLTGNITGYRVYKKLSTSSSWGPANSLSLSSCSLSGNIYSCTLDINNLTNNSLYDFKIVSVNSNTEVDTSNIVSATPTFVPFITNFSAVDAATDGRINFSWQSPKTGVSRYEIIAAVSNGYSSSSFSTNSCQTSGNNYVCSSAMMGLTNGQVYNARVDAYNSNNQVIGSSNIISVTPTKTLDCPKNLTYNGYTYPIIKIKDKCWLADNLRTIKTNDGENIDNLTDPDDWTNSFSNNKLAYSWYKNDNQAYTAFGILYNKIAVDSGKLCPKGWHIPKGEEVDKMVEYLRSSSAYWCGGSSVNIAKSLSSISKWHLSSTACDPGNNPTANNYSRFNGLPGGRREGDGTFAALGDYAYFWKTNGMFNFGNGDTDVFISNYTVNDSTGFSARCVMD